MSISRRALFALLTAAVTLPKTVSAAVRRRSTPFVIHLADPAGNPILKTGDRIRITEALTCTRCGAKRQQLHCYGLHWACETCWPHIPHPAWIDHLR